MTPEDPLVLYDNADVWCLPHLVVHTSWYIKRQYHLLILLLMTKGNVANLACPYLACDLKMRTESISTPQPRTVILFLLTRAVEGFSELRPVEGGRISLSGVLACEPYEPEKRTTK